MLLNLCTNCSTLAELLLFCVISIFLLKLLYFCLHEFYIHVIGSLTLNSRLKNYGEWAVVTGCTRGLGVEYCQQLAKLGINLALLARNETLVKKQAQELEKSYGIKTCCIIVDFDSIDEKSMNQVFEALKDKDVGILVNNAGVMYEFPDVLHNIDDQVLKRISNVNVTWPIRLCHYLVKEKMLDKKKGLIVFMSSAAGKRRTPLLTAYGASKGLLLSLLLPEFVHDLVAKYWQLHLRDQRQN
uniref:Uncharacterized protein n=1 Tax=Romanomermis culicivorax TaxID=13658 RepID=A0A915IH07_ROMCU